MISCVNFLVAVLVMYDTEERPAKMPRLDDFADLCDPQEMGRQRNELAEYVNVKVSKDTDLIQFWLDNKSVMPKLHIMARRVLCVAASSAASERVFSTAGRLLE